MWQPLKKVEREATTCRMNWEVRFVLKMKSGFTRETYGMELLENESVWKPGSSASIWLYGLPREIMWQEPTMRRQGEYQAEVGRFAGRDIVKRLFYSSDVVK